MTNWVNDDGLTVQFGAQRTADRGATSGAMSRMVVNITATDLPGFTTDSNNDGTNDSFDGGDPYIPAGSYITNAYLVVTTAFAGGTSINFGLNELDGTVIDADGLDAGVATAAMAANRAVAMDGALVGGTVTVGADDAYVKADATGAFTAGAAKLVIEYITV